MRNAFHFFASCEEVEAARTVFDESSVRDLVSWNSSINGYVKSGSGEEALRVYSGMKMERSVVPIS